MDTLTPPQTMHPSFGNRLFHLFRLELPRWIQASLAIVLISAVATAGFRILISLLIWLGTDLKIEADGVPASLKIYAVVWFLTVVVCFPFFIAGTFSDLYRPAARLQWLLLPARLWEKLAVRWFCSCVIFQAINVLFGSLLILIIAIYLKDTGALHKISFEAMHKEGLPEALLGGIVAHGIFFFASAIFRHRIPAIILGSVFILTMYWLDKAYEFNLAFWLLLLPGTWVVMKWSRA